MKKYILIVSIFLLVMFQSCSKHKNELEIRQLVYYYAGKNLFLVGEGSKKLIVKKINVFLPFNWRLFSEFKINISYVLEDNSILMLPDPIYLSSIEKDIYEGGLEASSSSIIFNAKNKTLKINSLRTFDDFRILPPWGMGMDDTIKKMIKKRNKIKSLPYMGYLYSGEKRKYIKNNNFNSQWIQLNISTKIKEVATVK